MIKILQRIYFWNNYYFKFFIKNVILKALLCLKDVKLSIFQKWFVAKRRNQSV